MKIQQIRNATVKICCGGLTFLVDPWLQDRGTGFSAKTVRPEMDGVRCPLDDLPLSPAEILSGVDFCLLTHLHPDHFSEDYLPLRLPFLVQNEAERQALEKMGFTDVRVIPNSGMTIGTVTVLKAPALHGDSPELAAWMGEVSGFVLKAEGKTLYLAADTIYFDGVAETIRLHSPDAILLNCCEATTPQGRLIMNCADVEAVCNDAPDALIIATHLDSVNHALVSGEDLRRFVQQRGLSSVVVPHNGEWVELAAVNS